ncbi:MAG TPA: ThuA domain-containing protein [Candidatus Anammoximicrobium sp.]|nr:ThuA domain-containing protein [Candidatus Anammoximicrobium sp.]
MKPAWRISFVVVGLLLLAPLFTWANAARAAAADAPQPQVLIVVGPSTHPPGTHEVTASARVMQYMLEHAEGIPPVAAEVVDQWPQDKRLLDHVKTVVFTGDIFPGETLPNPEAIKADLTAMMARGCGIVCVHYATGLRAQHVTKDGDHPLLRWMGGYFATGCEHHRSVARVVTATLTPAELDHPVLRGWKTFTFDDEPYWNNYFGKDGPAANVTPLVTTMMPPEAPKKETVVWAVQRPDGGRGLGIVVPHYFRNWRIDDLRTLVLNGICWTAKVEIPAPGVRCSLPDLAKFDPASVEPLPPQKPKPKTAS